MSPVSSSWVNDMQRTRGVRFVYDAEGVQLFRVQMTSVSADRDCLHLPQ